MNNLFSVVTLLYLLKSSPKSSKALINSGYFYSVKHFRKTLETCKRSGLITVETQEFFTAHDVKRYRKRVWWRLTTLGLNFLHYFDNQYHKWVPMQVIEVGEK